MTVGGRGAGPDGPRDGAGHVGEPDPPEELLATGRAPLPRWTRAVATVAVLLVAAYVAWYAVTNVLRGTGPAGQQAARPGPAGPRIVPPLVLSPGKILIHRSADIACDTGLAPWVRARRAPTRTGLQVLVGGTRLRRVDFDSGRSSALPLRDLRPDEWVSGLPATGYATTASLSCDVLGSRLLRIDGGRAVTTPHSSAIVADETRVWSVADPPHVLHPIGAGHDVALPAGFSPVAATDGYVAGNLTDAMDSGEIGIVDTRTGLLHGEPGRGAVLAAGGGRVFLTQGCDAGTSGPCRLRSVPARGGPAHTYRLPGPPGAASGQVDATGTRLAFTLGSRDADGDGDASVVVLDLPTGRLSAVPGIEVTAGYQPQFGFAPRGRWLVMSFARGGHAQLVAWRAGLRDPVRSPVRQLVSPAAPPVVVLLG